MKSEINLRPPIQNDTKSSRVLRTFRILAIGGLFVILVMAIILFFLFQEFSPSALKKQENGVLYSLSQLRQKEAKLFAINDRAKSISSIIDKRPNFTSWIDIILQKIPSDVSINSMTVNEGKISLTVSSKSLLSINSLLNGLISMAENRMVIKDITVDGLTADVKAGVYSLSLEADTL